MNFIWDSFENEVQYIWKNCQTYNEDGSEMYNLAAEFEASLLQHSISRQF